MAKRLTYDCGTIAYRKIISEAEGRAPGEKRKPRNKPTVEAVEKTNQRNSEKELAMVMQCNCEPGDYHLALTYSGEEPDGAEAKRGLDNLLNVLRRWYRKNGINFYWIAATEYENKRIHHHLLIPKGMELEEISRKWKWGYIYPRILDDTGDYRKLASYLIKETSRTFRKEEAVSKRRWTCSRNVKRPIVREEKVSNAQLLRDPEAPRGYYIDQDSIYRGENPFTGTPFVEYAMIKLEPERKRIRLRGKKIKWRSELFDRWIRANREMQFEFEIEPVKAGAL